MDLGLYKKIFTEHFAKYVSHEKSNHLHPLRSFQNFYHHVVFVTDPVQKDKQQTFSDYLKRKKDIDQIKMLDRTSKVLDSLSNLLDKDPKILKTLDYAKVLLALFGAGPHAKINSDS